MYVTVCMWKTHINIYIYTYIIYTYSPRKCQNGLSIASNPTSKLTQLIPDKPPEHSWLQLKLGAPLWRALRSWGNTYTSWLHLAPLWDKDHHHHHHHHHLKTWLWLPYIYIYIYVLDKLHGRKKHEHSIWTWWQKSIFKIVCTDISQKIIFNQRQKNTPKSL